MKKILLAFVFAIVALPSFAEELIVREVLTEKPLSGGDGMTVTVSRLSVMPGGSIPRHTHPGDEHALVLKGGQMTTDGGQVINFAAGTPLFFPAGSVHGGLTNTGSEMVQVVTTHILRDGNPFLTLAE